MLVWQTSYSGTAINYRLEYSWINGLYRIDINSSYEDIVRCREGYIGSVRKGDFIMQRLSAYIITLNEELRLPKTLKALSKVSDEIIVVDSGSDDRTLEIARSFGANVYSRKWDNYSAQKQYAERLCSGDWLLNIDADEEISDELAEEMRTAIESDMKDLYKIHIIDVYPGHKKPNRWVKHFNVIRLYRRGYAQMGETFTCDRVQITRPNARVGQLHSMVYHHSFVRIHQVVCKYNDYTEQQIETAAKEGRHYSPWRMVLVMSLNFFKYFILHRQFLYGFWGYINAMNLSYLRFLKFAKYYEHTQREKHIYPPLVSERVSEKSE